MSRLKGKKARRSEEVLHQSQHVLFVEGKNKNSVDPKVLNELFDNVLRIEPLGPSFYVKSVAEALYQHHPTYYFLIDRDHHDDEFIQNCWENFPNPDKHNLLVWKKREIENYFIDPEYLINSKYCEVSKDELKCKVLEFSKTRLYLDAANHVVIAIREELKQNWIRKFSKPEEFTNKEVALTKLINASEFENYAMKISERVSTENIENRFNQCLEQMTGGQNGISFGTGSWLSMIQGKKVLSQVINSNCFRVKATDGTQLSGKEKLNAIIKDLLNQDKNILPADFNELKQLILTRLNGTNVE